jgi:transposase
MKTTSSRPRSIPLARRALIVQRIIVDGWTGAEAAAAFNVSERQVDIWVAGFRREGMRSLRRKPGKTLAADLWRTVREIATRIATTFRRSSRAERSFPLSPLQRLNDDRRSGD